ncbi:response regulator [Mesorhizobium sp. CO1-1-7]|uniref:response regulator n=1 Tax=unclassified Mesorhizobium TaxID=325217 RepID=UPI0011276FA4|nr:MULTISPECIES: response regulator [unclassified Mesorhizobium]MBZ9747688.1 response regulator [Mesorhizobium sp. CO1-1-7]TPK73851.1 response regulator [Mesorhizobium sp. B2-4-18]TPL79330.1 response regulator [Mesorhizobium sp. B2-3-14]TPL99652.1 response regulator [Mesorhizobium sp. B2-3-10]
MPSEKPVVLILEDEALIAFDIEAALNDGGFNAVVLASCAEGETFLAAARPDAAVLDVSLKDGECSALAKTLVARGVPFIVHTGSDPVAKDDVFSRGIAFGKPSNPGCHRGQLQ